MTFIVCCKSAQVGAFMFFQAGCWLWLELCLAAGTPLVLVIFDTCQTHGAVLALPLTKFSTLSHSWPPSGMSGHLKSTWMSDSLWITATICGEGVEQTFDLFKSLCLNVCFVFVTMSHAAVCLVQPIFTFYNIMGVWLKYIQLGWSCYFVVSITTQLTKFVGLVVYLFVQWCVTWFSSLATTAVLLLFHGTLSFWQLGDLDCYVQVLEPASLFSVSILNCLYVSTMQFTSVSCVNCGILRSHAYSTVVPIGSTSRP